MGLLSRTDHRTPNFRNPEFQFPKFKVLQNVFSFFDITSNIGILGSIFILNQNFCLEKLLKK